MGLQAAERSRRLQATVAAGVFAWIKVLDVLEVLKVLNDKALEALNALKALKG
jgi:hypothetical protein